MTTDASNPAQAADLASPPPSSPSPPEEKPDASLIPRIFGLTTLAALCIELTNLCLSPVYGGSALPYNKSWEINLVSLVFITNSEVSTRKQNLLVSAIPILGCAIPTILSQSFQFSSQLGPSWGPTLTSLATILPLLYLTLLQVLQDNMALARQTPELLNNLGPYPAAPLLGAAWGTLYVFRRVAKLVLQFSITTFGTAIFTRFGMQVILSLVFAGWAFKNKQSWVASLALLSVFSIHVPAAWNDARLHAVLEGQGYALVARQESVTGYVSVLDNVKDGFRVMRCDHSLLGGEWLKQEAGSKLREPVYAIFVMLEAVRLAQTKSMKAAAKADSDKKALAIGLGVGTSPTALIAHGIKTTSIEIDPVVHAYATKYFDLPAHNSIIGNAIPTVKTLRNGTYDYIIHDVFTGGVEPLDLFTSEFLDNLKGLLTHDGTIAINYAGDLLLPTAASVVSTILAVFPTCRIFRESAPLPPDAAATAAAAKKDFTNLVLFCRKSADESFSFRTPTAADFLGSGARKQFLLPQHEVSPEVFGIDPSTEERDETKIIDKASIKALARSQEQSRQGHWWVMRGVVPDAVWENW